MIIIFLSILHYLFPIFLEIHVTYLSNFGPKSESDIKYKKMEMKNLPLSKGFFWSCGSGSISISQASIGMCSLLNINEERYELKYKVKHENSH